MNGKIFYLRLILQITPVLFFFGLLNGQESTDIPLGTWRDHLPFNKGLSVSQSPEKVICATENGLIILDRVENSIETLSRASGLSDLDLSWTDYHAPSNTFLIAYKNGNIDFLKGNRITNFSDIKRSKSIQGAKKVNRLRVIGNLAYLCCNFGLVVIDIPKREVRSTIFPSMDNPEIFDISGNNDSLYIATSAGVFSAGTKDPSLPYYIAWKKRTEFGNGRFEYIDFFKDELYATLKDPGKEKILRLRNGIISDFFSGFSFAQMRNSNGALLIPCFEAFVRFNPKDTVPEIFYSYDMPGVKKRALPKDAITDFYDKSIIWIADDYFGLIKSRGMSGRDLSIYTPQGPHSRNVFSLTASGEDIWVSPGAFEEGSYSPYYIDEGIFRYNKGLWSRYEIKDKAPLMDFISISADPSNNERVYASSWGFGLGEFLNSACINKFTPDNSTLQGLSSFPDIIRISGSAFDRKGNLWIGNSSVNKPVAMKSSAGEWKSYSFSSDINFSNTGAIMIDSTDQKWMILPDKGILVFNNNQDYSLNNYRRLSDQPGQGALSTNTVLSLATDLDGRVWVGTSKGISVFYNPEQILQGNAEIWDSQRIIVNLDGYNQYLLDEEEVTAICVDGANRKWLGTKNAGLFLVSDDGTEQIYHFSTENSLILSNNIRTLAMNGVSGELFIGTDAGICSFRTDATDGGKIFNKVYAFPNPVTPEYSGQIAIRGLVRDADVKITDVSGNLVFRTTAKGGTATWNGMLYSGERASTGVYLVFCTNEDGSETKVAKLLFIR